MEHRPTYREVVKVRPQTHSVRYLAFVLPIEGEGRRRIGQQARQPFRPAQPFCTRFDLRPVLGRAWSAATFANNCHRLRGRLSNSAQAETPAEPVDRRTSWCFSIVELDSIVAGSSRHCPQW